VHVPARGERSRALLRRPDRERPLRAVLVANKSDLPPQRHQVRLDMAQDWATNNGLDFVDAAAVRLQGTALVVSLSLALLLLVCELPLPAAQYPPAQPGQWNSNAPTACLNSIAATRRGSRTWQGRVPVGSALGCTHVCSACCARAGRAGAAGQGHRHCVQDDCNNVLQDL
jgi:hypothetical protein